MNDNSTRYSNRRSGDRGITDPERVDRDVDRQRTAVPAFQHKGIGSNLFLTAAAAIVPMVIVGVAALTSLPGRRRR